VVVVVVVEWLRWGWLLVFVMDVYVPDGNAGDD
jgi:hypothetical protein